MELIPGLTDLIDGGLQEALALDESHLADVLDVLQTWIAEHSFPVDNAQRRITQVEQFSARLTRLCKPGGFSVEIDTQNRLVLRPGAGDSESTLTLLKRGTNWFEGCHDLEELVGSAVF